jgi:hypothetical protein
MVLHRLLVLQLLCCYCYMWETYDRIELMVRVLNTCVNDIRADSCWSQNSHCLQIYILVITIIYLSFGENWFRPRSVGYILKDSPRSHAYNCWVRNKISRILCNNASSHKSYSYLQRPITCQCQTKEKWEFSHGRHIVLSHAAKEKLLHIFRRSTSIHYFRMIY